MNEPSVTSLRPGVVYRVAFWLPDPEPGAGERLFKQNPNWTRALAYWLRAAGFGVDGVRVLYGPTTWGPRGYRPDLGDYAQLWVVDLEIRGAEVPVGELESALFAALDTWVKLGPVAEVAEQTPYKPELPGLPHLGGFMNELESSLGQVAALALLALAIVLVSRLWPLGGMALLAALLILVMTDEGGATHAQA